MTITIRRTMEGILGLALSPSKHAIETCNLTIFCGNLAGEFVPACDYFIPFQEVSSGADLVLPGSVSVTTTPLPSGIAKVGFPKGKDANGFERDDLKVYFENVGIDVNRASMIMDCYDEFIKADVKLRNDQVETYLLNFLVGKPEVACMMYDLHIGFINAIADDCESIEGLEQPDRVQLGHIRDALTAGDGAAKNLFVSPRAMYFIGKVAKDYVGPGTDLERQLRSIIGLQCLSSLSTAIVYSALRDATITNLDTQLKLFYTDPKAKKNDQ